MSLDQEKKTINEKVDVSKNVEDSNTKIMQRKNTGNFGKTSGFGVKRDYSRFNHKKREEFDVETIQVKRVSKTTTGGRIQRIAVLVVCGGSGKIGIGSARSSDMRDALKKAENQARKQMINVATIDKGRTIAFDVSAKHCGTKVILRSSKRSGVGLVAGGVIRKMMAVLGIKDIVCSLHAKSGSPANVAACVIKCLAKTKSLNYLSEISGQTKEQLKERVY